MGSFNCSLAELKLFAPEKKTRPPSLSLSLPIIPYPSSDNSNSTQTDQSLTDLNIGLIDEESNFYDSVSLEEISGGAHNHDLISSVQQNDLIEKEIDIQVSIGWVWNMMLFTQLVGCPSP